MERCIASPRTSSPGPATTRPVDSVSNRPRRLRRHQRSPPPTDRSGGYGSRLRAGAHIVDEQIDRCWRVGALPPARSTPRSPTSPTRSASTSSGEFSVGHDSPGARRPAPPAPMSTRSAVTVIADWFVLGSKAIDRSVDVLTTGTAERRQRSGPNTSTSAPMSKSRREGGATSAPRPATSRIPPRTCTWDRGETNDPVTTDTGTRRSAPCASYADVVDTEAPLITATAFFHDGIRRLGR